MDTHVYGFRDGRRPGPGGGGELATSTQHTSSLSHPLLSLPLSYTDTLLHALAYLGRRRRSCPAVPVRRATSQCWFALACIAVELGIRNNMTNLRLPAPVAGASVGFGVEGWVAEKAADCRCRPSLPGWAQGRGTFRPDLIPAAADQHLPRPTGAWKQTSRPPSLLPAQAHKLSPCPSRVAGWGPEGIWVPTTVPR